MKPKLLTALLSFAVSFSWAQDFPGFRAGNYTGVNGVFYNPASIADSRYRFDFNLISVSTGVGNSNASYNINSLVKSFDVDSLQNQIFGRQAGLSSGLVSVDIHGPSFMFNTGRKSAFALTTRGRTMANIIDVDGRIAHQLLNDMDEMDENGPQYPYTVASNANTRIAVNAWSEVGLSYGRVLKDKGAHFFKGGLTLKYLLGAANVYVNMNQIKGTINEDAAGDVYLANTTGRVAVGIGGIGLSEVDFTNIKQMKSRGLGADIGFVYEFRPDHESYKMGEDNELMRDRNKYKVKLGVALLDLGKIRYTRDVSKTGEYAVDITGSERFYVDEFSETEVEDYNEFFNSRPEYFTAAGKALQSTYPVALPTTLQLDVDYRLHRGFYAQLAAQLPLSTNQVYNSRYYSSVTLTPRYEGRAIGLYVPINYNSLTHFNAGVSLRMGPLFIGSGSVLTAAFGNAKQADVHVGLHFAGLQKNKFKKEQKKLKKQNRKNDAEQQSL